MRSILAGCLLALTPVAPAACELRWPDPTIDVPPLVQSFIVAECREFAGTTGETLAECISGEAYGYRATVELLSDPDLGEAAAARYRGCAAGLGREGGRFHRRKAECLGTIHGIIWRFEFSRRADAGGTGGTRHAMLGAGTPADPG